MLGLLALLLGNAFIVGINQIYDVDIDKVGMSRGTSSLRPIFVRGLDFRSCTVDTCPADKIIDC